MIEPTEQEIQRVAYDFWERRGGGDGFAQADWYMAMKVLRLAKNYGLIFQRSFVTPQKTSLGSKDRCRFCGKSSPVTTFATESHAVPRLLGNQSIVALYECDACNKKSSKLEDELGKLTLSIRSVLQIRGGDGIPTAKSGSKKTRIDVPEFGKFQIEAHLEDGAIEPDEANKQIIYRFKTPRFTPVAAFKSLTKAALALMPQSEIVHFELALQWVMDEDHTKELPVKPAICFHALTPGPFPDQFGQAMLFRRIDDAMEVPYMMLVLETANLTLQIPVALSTKDAHLVGKQITFLRYPAGIGLGFEFGEPRYAKWDLSSSEKEVFPIVQSHHVEHWIRRSAAGHVARRVD